MQRWFFFFVFTLLVEPLATQAQQAMPLASLDNRCSVPVDPHWTDQEKFVWQHVCIGKVADFNTAPGYGGEFAPKEPDRWQQNRVLRPTFLATILLKEPYHGALTRSGIIIRGARFVEAIDIADAEIDHPFELQDSRVEKSINLGRVRSKFSIGFQGSKVAGKLNMNALQADGSLFMGDEAEFTDVDLVSAHVGGNLSLTGSKVTGMLDMNGIRIEGSLYMRGRAEFAEVDLGGAHVGGDLSFAGSKVAGMLDMNGLRIDGSLFMRDRAEFAKVDLGSAHVGGDISLTSSKVVGMLDMNGLQADGPLLMGHEAEFGDIILVGAHVRGQFYLGGSKFAGNIRCYGLVVEQQVLADGATFGGPIDCRVAKISGDAVFSGAHFGKDVDFSETDIGGKLAFFSTQWSEGVTLSLNDAKVGMVPDLADAWPAKLQLDRFTYRSVGAVDKFEDWFRKLDHYTPQPYDQLASIVKSQGDSALATKIGYSGRDRERREATGRTRVWLTSLQLLIGYGYYPYFAIFWVISLVMVGALALRASGEGLRNGMPFGIAYSFDMLLPVVRLREGHYKIDLQTWVRYYFYVQKIMGYVLASFLIAGLSGLTK